jgi:acyl-[acyl-carrier-protein]-phospholipid O-acyltransferase/long-chain-fatty-acid--[acyl-carrier-protein] ligase
MRSLLRLLLKLCFRFRAYNTGVLKTPGPVLLIPNHATWIDWLFLWVLLDLDWKFVVSNIVAQYSWLHRKVMLNRRTFPVEVASPYAVKRLAEYLGRGGRLVLFAEGQMTYTGSLMKLYDGTGFLLHKTQAKLITCYLRGANRLRWSRQPGWRKWWPRISVHFSPVLEPPGVAHLSASEARTRLTNWLRDQMLRQQFQTEMEFEPCNILDAIIASARLQPGKTVLQDATMQELTYRRLLVGADLLADKLRQALAPAPVPPLTPALPPSDGERGNERASVSPSDGEGEAEPVGGQVVAERVGVLLPNVNATPVVLLSLWALGRVPAVLNFSTGLATMLACAQLAGLRCVVTSQAFLRRARLNVEPFAQAGLRIIYLEDLRAQITKWEKLAALIRLTLNPAALKRHANQPGGLAESHAPRITYHASRITPGPPIANRQSPIPNPKSQITNPAAVILFTSGSEGAPKGVELTHANLLANIRQMLAVIDLTDRDRFFNALPLFHSFGLTVGALLGLVRGLYVFLYPSPLHYRVVPTLFYDRHSTVFLSTNTFLNGYARKAHAYDFRSLRYLFAGAEKVQDDTARAWAQRFGVRVLEGYGATECSPVISANTPMAPRHGSAGRLLPGIQYRIEPVEGVTEGGRLFVRGPNVMRGYLNPDANAKFKELDGWYDTGDIARVDDHGYVFILGRLKRFAKVSGEMVSLTAVEDALAGAFPQYGLRCQVAIIARPDPDKGEALVAVANEPKLKLDEIRAAIRAKGFTNLCVPREVKYLREIPKLGTGKVNHRELVKLV